MLVRIESYFGDRLISGKKCSGKKLEEKMKNALKIKEAEDFTSAFCRIYQFNEHPYSNDIRVDMVIDLDTYLVYAPRYSKS